MGNQALDYVLNRVVAPPSRRAGGRPWSAGAIWSQKSHARQEAEAERGLLLGIRETRAGPPFAADELGPGEGGGLPCWFGDQQRDPHRPLSRLARRPQALLSMMRLVAAGQCGRVGGGWGVCVWGGGLSAPTAQRVLVVVQAGGHRLRSACWWWCRLEARPRLRRLLMEHPVVVVLVEVVHLIEKEVVAGGRRGHVSEMAGRETVNCNPQVAQVVKKQRNQASQNTHTLSSHALDPRQPPLRQIAPAPPVRSQYIRSGRAYRQQAGKAAGADAERAPRRAPPEAVAWPIAAACHGALGALPSAGCGDRVRAQCPTGGRQRRGYERVA